MELMSTSLDKFYKYVYCALDNVIPEEILGKITLAVSTESLCFFIIAHLNLMFEYQARFFFSSADC